MKKNLFLISVLFVNITFASSSLDFSQCIDPSDDDFDDITVEIDPDSNEMKYVHPREGRRTLDFGTGEITIKVNPSEYVNIYLDGVLLFEACREAKPGVIELATEYFDI